MIKFKNDNLKFSGNYRGEVMSNTDPDMLGRIKVKIHGVFNGIATADIPWAIPAFPISRGSGSGFGYFSVPEVGSFVWCFFEQEDVYQPVYFAEAADGVHGLPSERTTNYPSRKVLKTKNGIVIYIDDASGSQEIKVSHPSGSYVMIDSNGKILIHGGDITIDGGAIVIDGTSVSINP
jgi:uncharacterized protein involved in type VI secretion and phage assembly